MLGAPGDFLVPLDDPSQTEGKTAWEQIVDVAIKKAPVYMEGAANILVVESDSECLDLMENSAVQENGERSLASCDAHLHQRNGHNVGNIYPISCRPVPS